MHIKVSMKRKRQSVTGKYLGFFDTKIFIVHFSLQNRELSLVDLYDIFINDIFIHAESHARIYIILFTFLCS